MKFVEFILVTPLKFNPIERPKKMIRIYVVVGGGWKLSLCQLIISVFIGLRPLFVPKKINLTQK